MVSAPWRLSWVLCVAALKLRRGAGQRPGATPLFQHDAAHFCAPMAGRRRIITKGERRLEPGLAEAGITAVKEPTRIGAA